MEGPTLSIEDIRFGVAPLVQDTIEVDGATYVKVIQGEHGRIYYDGMDWLKNGMKEKTFLEFYYHGFGGATVKITCDAIYYDSDGVEPVYGEYTMTAGAPNGDYLIVDKQKLYVIGKICPEVSKKFGHRYEIGVGALEAPFTYFADWLLEQEYVWRTDMMHDMFFIMEAFTGITHSHYVRRK